MRLKCLAVSLLTLTLLAALSLANGPIAHAQALTGQLVTEYELYPTLTTVFANNGSQVVTPTGVVFTSSNNGITTQVTPTQVIFTPSGIASLNFATFNGFGLAISGLVVFNITGVTLVSSTVPGFTASRVSFDSADIFANFQGLSVAPRQQIVLDINPAPEPLPIVTLCVGMLSLTVVIWRARMRTA